MARATFVKAARKDYPQAGIKKGESYYHWAFMVGGRGGPKHYSKTPPTRSQLTSSSFLSQIYELEDRGFTGETPEDLQSELESLADECDSSLQNMPEGLQQGDTGQLLESRAEGCRETASEFENIDLDYDEPDDDEVVQRLVDESASAESALTADTVTASMIVAERAVMLEEWCEEKRQELTDVEFQYE